MIPVKIGVWGLCMGARAECRVFVGEVGGLGTRGAAGRHLGVYIGVLYFPAFYAEFKHTEKSKE